MRLDHKRAEAILHDVTMELISATKANGTFNSAHEGWAVIFEELDELWDEVKLKHPDKVAMRKEAIQVAAMAIRFIHDIIPAKE